jgi:AraC-like DNA-binding protein
MEWRTAVRLNACIPSCYNQPMPPTESVRVWSVPYLNNLHLLSATFVTYAFKRHMHDYFVIGMVEEGLQRFDYGRDHYITPPSGLIIINPGEPHTGEAAVASGFRYRALYPEAEMMQSVAAEVRGHSHDIPFFAKPVIDDVALFDAFHRFHTMLEGGSTRLEQESAYLWMLAQLVTRHADPKPQPGRIGRERVEIQRIRRYLDAHYADDVKLADLAALVHWSPFYLLRVFRNEVGLPPHAYLETIRVREAQRLLKIGTPLANVAYDTGFSSQSHFTTTFKRLIGVTPGQYARQMADS